MITISSLCREPIVLASGSASRRAVLEAAGVATIIDKPNVDEDRLKQGFKSAGLGVREASLALARAKAEDVQPRHPGRIVIGGDQMLDLDGAWFDKPADRAAAARHLRALSGRTHRLVSAIVAMRDDVHEWSAVETAALSIRSLSDEFIEAYLDTAGDRVLSSVGAYQVEGLGIQLFSEIRGDHSTILGLPLLPLMEFLRSQGILLT